MRFKALKAILMGRKQATVAKQRSSDSDNVSISDLQTASPQTTGADISSGRSTSDLSSNTISSESWDQAPPHDPICDIFDLRCQRHPPPAERHSAPPVVQKPKRASRAAWRSSNIWKAYAKENVRLRAENDSLADRLEETGRELEQTRLINAQLAQDILVWQDVAEQRGGDNVRLEKRVARLAGFVKALESSRFSPKRQLRKSLAEAEVSAAELRMELEESAKRCVMLEDDAWELWDAIMQTGAQGNSPDSRAARAMNRMSAHFGGAS